mmetsp:Transcript_5232/g.14648  ORF Transcript_5232/g.14648 Transcript_5232/m.14648 type:complete len:263 (-) Transcript_5232:103-891(-)
MPNCPSTCLIRPSVLEMDWIWFRGSTSSMIFRTNLSTAAPKRPSRSWTGNFTRCHFNCAVPAASAGAPSMRTSGHIISACSSSSSSIFARSTSPCRCTAPAAKLAVRPRMWGRESSEAMLMASRMMRAIGDRPLALWHSSNTNKEMSPGSRKPLSSAWRKTSGVPTRTVLIRNSFFHLMRSHCSISCPHNSATTCSVPQCALQYAACWPTKVFVGTVKTTTRSGFMSRKWSTTLTATKVLPAFVGRTTMVFFSLARSTQAAW